MKEVKAWGFAVANLAGTCGIPTPRQLRDTYKLLDYVKKLDGFMGVHPCPPHGTVLIFKTKQEAIRAQNLLKFDLEINEIGKHVVEIYIPEEYANG